MKRNIKLLIETLFDDTEYDTLFTDSSSELITDLFKLRVEKTIELLKRGELVNKNDLMLCQEKPYLWKPANMFELKQVINNIESNKDVSTFDLNWVDVSDFGSLSQLFSMCKKNYDVSKWDVSNVTSMYLTFYGCSNFNCDLSGWKTPKLRDLQHTFYGCKLFNSDISGWDVSNVTNMNGTFCNCKKFNAPIGNWNVSNVNDFTSFLFGADDFNQNLSSWDLRHVYNLVHMFYGTHIYKKPDMKPRIITEKDYIDLCKQYFEFYPKCEWDLNYDEGSVEYEDYSNPEDGEGYSIHRFIIEFGDTIDDYEIDINTENPEDCETDWWCGLNSLTVGCMQELYYDLEKHLNQNFTKINDEEDE